MKTLEPTLLGVALVADGDPDRGKAIAEACASRGLVARFAVHGAEALEAALADPPDLVIAALGLPLIDAPQLAGILRANPRTQGLKFLLVGASADEPLVHAAIDACVPAPVDPDAVVRRITDLLAPERGESRNLRRGAAERDLEGKLAQLPLADLLQLFHMNRKTGAVELVRRGPDGEDERGLVAVVDGNVVDARCGAVEGEKALHRLLGWRSGSFGFTRTRPGGPARIHTPTRALLLEGMRQLDELARLRAELPALDAEAVFRVPPGDLPPAVQPLTREVLRLLAAFPRVGEVVDRSVYPDYQVLRTIHALVERGLLELRRRRGVEEIGGGPDTLFTGRQLARLRAWAQRNHGAAAPLRDARLLVVAPRPALLRAFLGRLEGLPEVALEHGFRDGRCSAETLRRIGRMGPDGEVGIELLHLPAHPSCEALWGLAGASALGLLEVLQAPASEDARGLEALRRGLADVGPLRRFHVVLTVLDENGAGESAQTLAPGRDGAFFSLPLDAARDGRQVLAHLLARLVP